MHSYFGYSQVYVSPVDVTINVYYVAELATFTKHDTDNYNIMLLENGGKMT